MPRWRTELRDLCELVLAPAVAAVLPWRVAYALARRLLPRTRLYRAAADGAWAEFAARPAHALLPASATAQATVAQAWRAQRQVVSWVDHADHYLARTRGDAWMLRHLRVQGAWPQPGEAALLFTFHWGAGMWGLRHAAAQGLAPRALVASTEGEPFRGRTVLGWYARARTATVRQALRCDPLDVTGSLRPAIKALRAGGQVLAAIDVPADQAASAENIHLLGMPAAVPRALHRLAVEQKVPVYVYLTGFDPATGERTLHIHALGVYDDASALVRDVFGHLERAICTDSAAWHFWGEAPRFFRQADAG